MGRKVKVLKVLTNTQARLKCLELGMKPEEARYIWKLNLMRERDTGKVFWKYFRIDGWVSTLEAKEGENGE